MRPVARSLCALVLGLALILPVGAAAKKRKMPPPCLGRRFQVSEALVMGTTTIDAVTIDEAGMISLGGCAGARARFRRTRKGFVVRARWASCDGLGRRVRLRAVTDGDCSGMQGMLRVKGERPAPLTASLLCEGPFASTWEAIQKAVFARHGCTNDACHGSAAQGALDLRPDVAYRNLVDVPSSGMPSLDRVEPGDRSLSFLWLKLAKGTLPDEYGNVPGTAMPNGLPPLSADELEGVRRWIQSGAPETGIVPETDHYLTACLPPPEPIKIRPAPVPPADEGIQLHAPPWTIPPRNAEGQNGEVEVCYATYYDYSAQIPDSVKLACPDFWGGPSKQCFYLNRTDLTQDPNSHHSLIHIYKGRHNDITDPVFGPFTCKGGENDGQSCDPKGGSAQCPGGGCGGNVVPRVACIGFTDDFGIGISGGTDNAPLIGGSQQPHFTQSYPSGVYGVLPVQGIVVWNSHAFNVTDRPTTNEQYYNIYFARNPADRQYPIRTIFDSTEIFVQNVPPFQKREYCSTHTLPQGAVLFQLTSHTHKRGVLFRIWGPGITPCRPGPDCNPESGPPVALTTEYSDPVQYIYDPPLVLNEADPVSRTFKYCSVYDNGFTDPDKVKRQSTSPPSWVDAFLGSVCTDAKVACLTGPRKGQLCNGENQQCDSAPGAGDGICDACPLRGGVTTEDEMFILLGNGYCLPGSPCESAPIF